MNELLDIIQIEDYADTREICCGFLEEAKGKINLGYLGLSCLDELKENIKCNKTNMYIIDGRFPRKKRGIIENLAKEAIEIIKSNHKDAKIVLFSGDDNLKNTASRFGVEYINKQNYDLLEKKIREIK